MHWGAVILCGGRSSRMGVSKPMLPFGPECMLGRVVRLLTGVTSELVVAAGPQQQLPELPPGVRVVRDRREGRGPLEGLFVGLSGLPPHVEAAYATGCDVPLLVPEFAAGMVELLGEHDIAVPIDDGHAYPLAAVYRRRVLGPIESLLSVDRLRPAFLFDMVPTRQVPVDALRQIDPELLTLQNVNHPAEYRDALARAGFAPPEETR